MLSLDEVYWRLRSDSVLTMNTGNEAFKVQNLIIVKS